MATISISERRLGEISPNYTSTVLWWWWLIKVRYLYIIFFHTILGSQIKNCGDRLAVPAGTFGVALLTFTLAATKQSVWVLSLNGPIWYDLQKWLAAILDINPIQKCSIDGGGLFAIPSILICQNENVSYSGLGSAGMSYVVEAAKKVYIFISRISNLDCLQNASTSVTVVFSWYTMDNVQVVLTFYCCLNVLVRIRMCHIIS